MALQLLKLNASPALEEELVDSLLACEFVSGFQSQEVRGHGEGAFMSVAEQVSGRRKRIQFEVILDEENIQPLLAEIVSALPSSDIHYWVLPVLQQGRLTDS